MKLLERILKPVVRRTLARRVIMTLLASFAVVWVVLVAFYYAQETGQANLDAQQRNRGETVALALAQIDNVEQARTAMALYAAFFNANLKRNNFPGTFLLQLEDRQGKRLYMSPGGGAASLHGVVGELIDVNANGPRYRVFRGDTARWTVLVGEPRLDPTRLLERLFTNLGVSILISFPFVLLPTWFAVSRGLRPLRQLSGTIEARGPDDLASLGIDPKYEELTPVTAALDRLFAQLRTKMAREHAFVQDAAHELRTPMAVIAAQGHVLALADGLEERRAAGQRLELAIARASHLIQQLLDLAHIDAPSGAAGGAARDAAQLVRQEMASATPAAMARVIELSLEAPDVLTHTLEAHAFASIVQNLLTNAVRHGKQGGQVAVELFKHEGVLNLTVADDGPGIAEAERALVFERFYRVAGNDAQGSGLGLAIVAQAVARLNGSVRLEAGPGGRGCKFIVRLPDK
ncbi:ATP-binding protein [Massilia glaciei]|uniref:histidine kinase n=1 Tax=Massilia glaciei TaxID=1524097 RepID=A0A2U2HEW4_9BURK|nr:ATP-binding protein [Massilia glaciei]PWF42425.1 two-component sensor histidine kinase [Massilia glaciei]